MLHTYFNIPYVSEVIHEKSINITTNWKPIPIHYQCNYYNLQKLGIRKMLAIKLKVDTHYADVTWDHVTSDAVSKIGSLQLSAECFALF
jgi:hypothetical protein